MRWRRREIGTSQRRERRTTEVTEEPQRNGDSKERNEGQEKRRKDCAEITEGAEAAEESGGEKPKSTDRSKLRASRSVFGREEVEELKVESQKFGDSEWMEWG